MNGSGSYDFFLSHRQQTGGDQVLNICSILESRGFSCWLDKNFGENVTLKGMLEGVSNASCFLLFLSKGVFDSEYVLKELSHALEENKRIILVCESERPMLTFDFSSPYEKDVSSEMRGKIDQLLRGHNALNYRRDKHEREAFIDEVIKYSRLSTADRKFKSQQEVLNVYGPKILKLGRRVRKNVSAHIRKGIIGETITTTIDGKTETENTVKDNDSFVVCGVKNEHYILTRNEFDENYDVGSKRDAPKALKNKGYHTYNSKRSCLAYEVTNNDMGWFRGRTLDNAADSISAYFMAPWKEITLIEEGDFLLMGDNNNEIYRIEREVFMNSYESEDNKKLSLFRMIEEYDVTMKRISVIILMIAVFWAGRRANEVVTRRSGADT